MRDAIIRLILARRDRPLLPEWAHRLDEAGIARVAAMPHSSLDRALPALSRAANGGRLWMGIAGALAFTGRKERKAAMRGMAALSISSALVNGIVKIAARRRRPEPDRIPMLRRLAKAPVSSSFPSGHAASAAAFAVGASLEEPKLGAPLGVLAAGVAFSRVYNGAHYPSDVMAGVIVGAGIAVASKKLWPGNGEVIDIEPELVRIEIDAAPGGKEVVFLANDAAGSAKGVATQIAEDLPDARVEAIEPGDLLPQLHRACKSKPRALGIAGGDGSINAAAGVALEHDVPLAIIPAGTLNHLARDLGLSEAAETISAVDRGEAARIDVGMIDGKPFLNTASFGAYSRIVDLRERLQDRLGKWPAAAVAMARELRRAAPTEVEIDGRPRRLWAIFIGNCRYEPTGFAPARRRRLDDGRFDVRMLLAEKPWSRISLIAAAMTGDMSRSSAYEERQVERMRIRARSESLRLARDGETGDASREFVVEKASKRLTVFVPNR